MNILLFDNTQMVSKENQVLYCASGTGLFAKELVDLGNTVTMFGQRVIDPGSIADFDIEANGIKTISHKRGKIKIVDYLLLYFHAFILSFKYDFIYVFYPTSYKYFLLFCCLFHRPFGLYIRGVNGIYDGISRLLYKNAKAVFTVSESFTRFVNTVNIKNIAHTIRPMIPYKTKDILYREYHQVTCFNILYLGRIEKEKGISELIYAIRRVIDDNKIPLHLNIVGNGGFMSDTRYLIEELGLEEYISLLGTVNESDKKKELFINSDLYVLPTYHEGFPRTLYEAMIYGVPIITTLVGGIPSLMKDGYNCKSISPKSIDSIVESLSFAIVNYPKMIEYAQNGTKTVESVLDEKRPTHARDVHNAISKL